MINFMQITKDTVKYVAALARIELKEEELARLSGQLEGILNFIDKLKEADVSQVSPTSHILTVNNVLRKDELKTSLKPEKVLNNAPHKEGTSFVVPKVI